MSATGKADDEPCDEKMRRLVATLQQQVEAAMLDAVIAAKPRDIGHAY